MAEQHDRPRLVKPEEIKPVDVEEFSFAFAVGAAAYAYRMPMRSPTENKLLLEDEKGDVQEIRITDVPLNRAALAIRDQCQGDMEMFQAIMHRIFALMKLQSHEKMQQWTTSPMKSASIPQSWRQRRPSRLIGTVILSRIGSSKRLSSLPRAGNMMTPKTPNPKFRGVVVILSMKPTSI